jgi:hypothetical protein
MIENESSRVRLKVSAEVARIVRQGAPRDAQLAAARGALPLSGHDLLMVLFFLCGSHDEEIRKSAVATLREVPERVVLQLLTEKGVHPRLLDLLVRVRPNDVELIAKIILHPDTPRATHMLLARKGSAEVLERLIAHQNLLSEQPELVEAILANPAAERHLKFRLGWQEPSEEQSAPEDGDAEAPGAVADAEESEGRDQTDLEAVMEEADEEGLSKYQIALELKVAEKIKMALTGDKEWRNILIKEANKLIQAAVMKNPRITDGEVVMVAKNKTTSDDLIRLILLNKDWMKLYEIKKALVVHPKTPVPKALRLVSSLSTKDIKDLARSRQVSTIVATAARKELELRLKKTGG